MDADQLIADLDEDQRRAVTADAPLVAVIAGAGSGKTRVLTRRIAHRIAIGSADARHTLALTYTREAAGELRRRLSRLGIHEHVEAGTFHSVMLSVLKQRWADTDRPPRTVQPNRRRLLSDALEGGSRRGIDALLNEIDWACARGIGSGDYASVARRAHRRPAPGVDRCQQALEAYETIKRRRGVVDFDDVLGLVIRELERDAGFADGLRWRFRHLLVDEAQDLNPLQHRLVDLLRHGRNDLFIVGDPSQAIFGFNGADPSLLIDVEQRFPGVEIVRLPVNHRSTPQVVATGAHVLDVSGQGTRLLSRRGDGVPVQRFDADDEQNEADTVVGSISRIDPNIVRAGEVAILARTNVQLGVFADVLRRAGIESRRSASAESTPIASSVRRVAALGSSALLRTWAHDTLDAIDDLHTARAERVGRLDGDPATERERARAEQDLADLDADRRVAGAVLDFVRNQPLGDGAAFRNWVTTTDPFDERSSRGVALLTFHAAKGREWHTVFVTGVESGLVPHKSATTKEARAEEARLLYVAVTRATDRLVITSARRRGGYARTASALIADLDVDTPAPMRPPSDLRRPRSVRSQLLVALREWRDDRARRVDALPTQLCSDRDLSAIADQRPTTPAELSAITSFGLITAERLAPELIEIVERFEHARV